MINTPRTRGGPGGRDQTLAIKRRKTVENQLFFSLKNKIYTHKKYFFCIYFLGLPKYLVVNYFAHGRFPEVGQKQKKREKKKKRKKETERRLKNEEKMHKKYKKNLLWGVRRQVLTIVIIDFQSLLLFFSSFFLLLTHFRESPIAK